MIEARILEKNLINVSWSNFKFSDEVKILVQRDKIKMHH